MLGGVGRKEENLYDKEFLKYALFLGALVGWKLQSGPLLSRQMQALLSRRLWYLACRTDTAQREQIMSCRLSAGERLGCCANQRKPAAYNKGDGGWSPRPFGFS